MVQAIPSCLLIFLTRIKPVNMWITLEGYHTKHFYIVETAMTRNTCSPSYYITAQRPETLCQPGLYFPAEGRNLKGNLKSKYSDDRFDLILQKNNNLTMTILLDSHVTIHFVVWKTASWTFCYKQRFCSTKCKEITWFRKTWVRVNDTHLQF